MMNTIYRKLRILFITSDKFPPYRPAAKAIFGEELTNRGHIIDWLIQANKDCDTSYQIPYGNGTAYIAAVNDGVSRWSRLNKHILDLLNDLRMFRLFKHNKYDIIQVKDKYITALFAIILAKLNKIHFIYWLAYPHSESSLYQVKEGIARYRFFYMLRGNFLKFALYKIILPYSDHIFVQSEQMKLDIAAHNIPLYKMTPIPGSVNLSEIPYRDINENHTCLKVDNEKHIVYLGTLMRKRRLDFIIRVHAKIIRKYPNAKLYLIGKGEMPEDELFLSNEARRLGIELSIIFTGYLPMSKAWEYIRNADVCLSPYYPTPILNSTSPTKLIEYMAMGKAVVGNDHPEQSLVITESGAGICVKWDEEAFAEAICNLLDNPLQAQKMGIKGREYVEQKRTNSIMATLLEERYYQLLDKQVLKSCADLNE